MDLVLDLIERVPVPVLLGSGAGAAVLALLIAALTGGATAVVTLVVGALLVAASGGLLAVRVHLNRLPLELGQVGVLGKLDGHTAVRFRVRLGRGRSMDRARATVRYLPESGEAVELTPLLAEGKGLLGPWTVVVVDRHDQCAFPGAFEVRVQAREGSKTWAIDRIYAANELQSGRYISAIQPRSLSLKPADPWDAVRAPTGGEPG